MCWSALGCLLRVVELGLPWPPREHLSKTLLLRGRWLLVLLGKVTWGHSLGRWRNGIMNHLHLMLLLRAVREMGMARVHRGRRCCGSPRAVVMCLFLTTVGWSRNEHILWVATSAVLCLHQLHRLASMAWGHWVCHRAGIVATATWRRWERDVHHTTVLGVTRRCHQLAVLRRYWHHNWFRADRAAQLRTSGRHGRGVGELLLHPVLLVHGHLLILLLLRLLLLWVGILGVLRLTNHVSLGLHGLLPLLVWWLANTSGANLNAFTLHIGALHLSNSAGSTVIGLEQNKAYAFASAGGIMAHHFSRANLPKALEQASELAISVVGRQRGDIDIAGMEVRHIPRRYSCGGSDVLAQRLVRRFYIWINFLTLLLCLGWLRLRLLMLLHLLVFCIQLLLLLERSWERKMSCRRLGLWGGWNNQPFELEW